MAEVIYGNITFNCTALKPDTDPDALDAHKGVIVIPISIAGQWQDIYHISLRAIDIRVFMSWSENLSDVIIPTNPIDITLTISHNSDFDFILIYPQNNWVWWSKIGDLSFTMDRSNESGRRPMPWSGDVYDIRQLDNHVIVYGSNGISKMQPSGVHWGLKPIFTLGTKGKLASTGDDLMHWFVDTTGELWSYDGQFHYHGWKEYLAELGEISVNYDAAEKLVYICDGETGYVYSITDQSLGEGPSNVAGIFYRDNITYVTAPEPIVMPLFDLCTDIYDMGTRKEKTIFNIEVGVDVNVSLQASIDYRVNHKDIFTSLPWFPVTERGVAHINCYGVEFKFRVRALNYEYFELDYMKVNGVIAGFSFLDTITQR